MLSDSAVLWLFLGSTPVRTIFHVFTEQYVTSVLLKTFRSLQAPALHRLFTLHRTGYDECETQKFCGVL